MERDLSLVSVYIVNIAFSAAGIPVRPHQVSEDVALPYERAGTFEAHLARFLQTFNSQTLRRSHRSPAAWTVPLPIVHVKEFDAVRRVPRPPWKTMPVGAEGFIEIRSLWYSAHQYLFSQASSSRFRIVRSSSWDVGRF